MDLPAELRNQIYSYLFKPQRVAISRSLCQTNPTHNHHRLSHDLLAPRNPETQFLTRLPRNRRKQTQLFLPFVCKQFYADTLCLLYASTQFVFASPKCIKRFLYKTPKHAQAAIRHIEIFHKMYNEPSLTTFRGLKLKADKKWYQLCEKIALDFKALEVLHVTLDVLDGPIELEVGESWSQPILALGRGEGDGLRYARVSLRSRRFDNDKIREVERQLERELTNPIAMQIREDERLAREMGGPQKASKVLRLTFN